MKIRRYKDRWQYDFNFEGKRYRKVVGLSKTEANEAMRQRMRGLEREKHGLASSREPVLFENFASEFIENYSKAGKRSWINDENTLKKKFIPFLKQNRVHRLDAVTGGLVQQYLAERRKEISPASTNRELSLLKRLFNVAIEWGKAEFNPAAKIKKLREAGPRERILSEDEEAALMAEAHNHLRPFLVLALNTGMRRGEILSLRWENVSLESGLVLIEAARAKSGKERKVPINEPAREALLNLGRRSAGYVFINSQTRKPFKDIKTTFKHACKEAGIKSIRIHDLRHTFATRFIAAGGDLVALSKVLGHSSILMTMRYAHSIDETMRRGVDLLAKKYKTEVQFGNEVDNGAVEQKFSVPGSSLPA